MSYPYGGDPSAGDPGQGGNGSYGQGSSSQNPYGQDQFGGYGQNPYGQGSNQGEYGQNPNNLYGNPYGQPSGQSPYGQVPYPGDPYAQGAYGGYGMAHPQATTVLVLGILSPLVCFVTGIVAVGMSGRVLREIDANPGAYSNRQTVVIGRILGIVGIALQGLVFVGYIIYFATVASRLGSY